MEGTPEPPESEKNVPPVPDHRQPSQEYKAHFLSHLTFWWVGSLMFVGYQRRLELNDIWEVNPDRSVDVLRAKLLSSLQKRKDARSKRPLAMALYDTFKKEFLIGAFCQLTAACLQVLTPFTLKYLIDFATDSYEARHGVGTSPSIGYGVGLVFGITCMQLIQTSCTNHFIYRGFTVGGQTRSVLISVIFEKAMKLSGRARAGGKDPNAEEPMPKFEPGSKEEKAHFKAKLEASSPRNDVTGDGQGWPNGRIVNLMSTDTYRIDQASGMFHMSWTSPIQALLALALLCINLTYSALAGFGFIVIMLPLLSVSIKSLMVRRRAINKITDKRVSLTQEIISAVRFVKFFGWESSFLGRLKALRDDEISKVSTLLAIRNAIMAMSISTPIFACMLAFITYTSTHPTYYLDSGPIFSSLALFNSLRQPLTMLPVVLGQIVDAFASLGRIYAFLEAEELQDDTVWSPDAENAIEIANGAFTWERTTGQDNDEKSGQKETRILEKPTVAEPKPNTADKTVQLHEKAGSLSEDTTSSDGIAGEEEAKDTPFHLQGINLTVGRDELIVVIGSVGCGKSSLLAALAGDMRKTDGAVTFGSARAFCPQYAWIQNATVKENIIFNKEFDRDWYNQVVDACALRPDLEMLPAGDLTEIGERGITVSGGQKQRLNIARAIYFNADIVIMDDPLSAVDAHVGRHIMDNAICGLLKGKARVLATHQLHVLHRADRIVWMKEGAIHRISTFPELMANNTEFQKLMETTANEEKKAEEESNEDEVEEEKKPMRKRKDKKSMAALMQQEDRAVNGVSGEVWLAYIRSAGSIWVGPLVFLLLISQQAANIMTSTTLVHVFVVSELLWHPFKQDHASSRHDTGTPCSMSFFDTTPIGRIMNRFSKDVDTMDSALTDSIRMFGMTMVSIVAVFILILAYYWYFIAALVPLTFAFLIFASYYRASAPEVKRHEALLRSIVFARFGEAVNGISTIRAYGVQSQFAQSINQSLDSMDGAYFLTFANQRWLSTRLDAIGNLLVFVTGILVVTSRFSINPSTAGFGPFVRFVDSAADPVYRSSAR
ncbi:hypothetical protein MRB53_039465 [Persea americana]|nr:hypothetical protein MRB53_039465 [Persea americana]